MDQSLQLALTFVPYGNGYSPAIRQFGLNLLESIVKRLGQSSPLVEQGFLERLWGLAFGPAGLDAERGETRMSKEKMAVVLVQAAVRVWPQRWSSFFDQLMAEAGCLASPNGPQSPRQALNAELALTVIRMLIEEIQQAGDSDNAVAWDAERKQELQNALAVVMPEYAAWLWGALPTAAGRSRPDDAVSMAALQTLVRAWTVALGSITLPVASSPLAFATLFNIAQIYTGSLREDALDALLAFSARPLRTGEESLVTGLLDQEAERFEQLFAAFVKEASSSDDEDAAETAYGHLKRTAEMLVNFGMLTIGNRKHPSLPKRLGQVLALLLELLGLPSLIIRSLASLFWMSVSRAHERLWTEPELLACLPALFMRVLGGLATDRRTDRRHRWNRLDFDTERDFEEVSAAATNRLQCLLEAMAGRHVAMLGLLGQAMAAFCSDAGNAAALRSAIPPSGGPFGPQWAALSTASEAVCRGVGTLKEDATDAATRQQIRQQARSLLDALLSGLVEPQVTGTETLLAWLAMVRALAVLLAQQEGPDDTVPSSLLPGMLGLALGPTQFDPHVKGRVGALLLRLTAVRPALFHPHLESLAGTLEAPSSSAPGHVQRQRLATELLLAVGGTESVECVDRAVRPVLEELERAAPWLGSAQSLRSATVPEHSANPAGDSADFRRSLGNLLALIFICAQRLCTPSGALVPAVAEYVRGSIGPRLTSALLGLLTTLQAVSRPAGVWSPTEQGLWHDLFARRQPDATNVLAALDPAALDPAAPPADAASSTSTLRNWFSTVTVSALVSLGLLAKAPGFFADTRLIESLWAPYLAGWDCGAASPWALSWLLKHALHPLLVAGTQCPSETVAFLAQCPAFSAALDRLLAGLLSRLQSDWAALEAGAAGSPEEELERESELIMLSAALLSLAYDVLFPLAERAARTEPFLDLAARQPPSPVASPMAHWLAASNPVPKKRMVMIPFTYS